MLIELEERDCIKIKDRVSGPGINKKVNFLTCHIKGYPEFLLRDQNTGAGWDQSVPRAYSVLKCCHGLK